MEEGFLKTSSPSPVTPPSSAVFSAPRMPPRTSGCSQKCSVECHSPAPLPPTSEPPTLTLLFCHSLLPTTSYLSSLCLIFPCSLPLVHKAQHHLQDLRSSLSTSVHHAPNAPLLFRPLQTRLCWHFFLSSTEKAMIVRSGKI